MSEHTPINDDGILYCGYDGHRGCGEAWPCSYERLRADYERSQFLLRIAARQIADLRGEPFSYEATVTGGYSGGEITDVEMIVPTPSGPTCDTCGRSEDLVWLEEPNGSRDGWFCWGGHAAEPGYSAEAQCRLCLHTFSEHDEHGCHAPGPFYAAIECECIAPIKVGAT